MTRPCVFPGRQLLRDRVANNIQHASHLSAQGGSGKEQGSLPPLLSTRLCSFHTPCTFALPAPAPLHLDCFALAVHVT